MRKSRGHPRSATRCALSAAWLVAAAGCTGPDAIATVTGGSTSTASGGGAGATASSSSSTGGAGGGGGGSGSSGSSTGSGGTGAPVLKGAFVGGTVLGNGSGITLHGQIVSHAKVSGQNGGIQLEGWLR